MKRLRPAFAVLAAGWLLAATGAPAAADEPQPAAETQEISSRYLLLDSKGRTISNEDFPGRFQLVSFGYTFCPDICPTTLAAMADILRRLGDRAPRLQPIFISVDPQRDTKEVLARYTAYFDPRIVGLTGSPELVRAAADHYKVVYRKYLAPGAAPDSYSIDHSGGMYLLGPDGMFIVKFAPGASAQETAARIANIMAAGEAVRPGAGSGRR